VESRGDICGCPGSRNTARVAPTGRESGEQLIVTTKRTEVFERFGPRQEREANLHREGENDPGYREALGEVGFDDRSCLASGQLSVLAKEDAYI
jgi:hypothetical protein